MSWFPTSHVHFPGIIYCPLVLFYSSKSKADRERRSNHSSFKKSERNSLFLVLRRSISWVRGTALSWWPKNYIYSISIKALFSRCYPVACWTFKRFLCIWFGFSSPARRIRSVAISNGSFFDSFSWEEKKHILGRRKLSTAIFTSH